MSTPHTYGQYCPLARALEAVGERWTLLIVRDLLGGPRGFNALSRGLPGMSRTLLSTRLQRLQDLLLVVRTDDGYALTGVGYQLMPVIAALGDWGAAHVFDQPRPEELDHRVLLWWMKGRVDTSLYEGEHTTLEFRFSDPHGLGWIVVREGDVDVCMRRPRYPILLEVRVDAAAWAELWLGRRSWGELTREGDIELSGSAEVARALPRSLLYSHSAGIVRKHAAEQGAGTEG